MHDPHALPSAAALLADFAAAEWPPARQAAVAQCLASVLAAVDAPAFAEPRRRFPPPADAR